MSRYIRIIVALDVSNSKINGEIPRQIKNCGPARVICQIALSLNAIPITTNGFFPSRDVFGGKKFNEYNLQIYGHEFWLPYENYSIYLKEKANAFSRIYK